MLAVLGDRARAAAQHGIGLRRPIAADDMDRLVGSGLLIDLPEQVVQVRIHGLRFLLAPVADQIIQLGEPGRIVDAVPLEDDGRLLMRVHVVDGQRTVAFRHRDALAEAEGGEKRRDGAKTQERRSAPCAPRPPNPSKKIARSNQYPVPPSCPSVGLTPSAHYQCNWLIPLYQNGQRHQFDPVLASSSPIGSDRGI